MCGLFHLKKSIKINTKHMFKEFKTQLQVAISKMHANQSKLYVTDADPELLWNTYLEVFPEDIRQEYNCSACRSFIKHNAAIVSIVDNKIVTMWDFQTIEPFNAIAKKLHDIVLNSKIQDVFVTDTPKLGLDFNFEQMEDGESRKWEHMFYFLPKALVSDLRKKSADSIRGSARENMNVLLRALTELSTSSVETVLELIAQKSVYRGEEFKDLLTRFLAEKKIFDAMDVTLAVNHCWKKSQELPETLIKIRNMSIGTLLINISDGMELDVAVEKFGKLMDPVNYRRPVAAIITEGMKKQAEEKLIELGLQDSLGRRMAHIDEVSVKDVMFINREPKKAIGLLDDLVTTTSKKDVKTFDKVEEIHLADFLDNIVPKAKNIELFVEHTHVNNFVSLVAPKHPNAPSLFKWDNGFSWSYTNAVADSMREKVVAAGGRVDGVFRFTHSWNELEPNQSLMDLHVFMPGNTHVYANNKHEGYGTGRRVGWNCRQDPQSGGKQDVDYINAAPAGYIPVENITFPNIDKMPEGKYICKIHNWAFRSTGGRGKAEIEFGGQIFQYEYPATKNKEWVTVATVELKNKQFTITHHLKTTSSSVTKWNIPTNNFQRVRMITHSPNFWDGKSVGNEHFFFMLEGAKSDETPRGFFNEFLKPELTEHKRVFEALGSRMAVEPSEDELSGVGFSSTQKAAIIVKVEGAFSRVLKVNI